MKKLILLGSGVGLLMLGCGKKSSDESTTTTASSTALTIKGSGSSTALTDASLAGNASSAYMKAYKFALSAKDDCSDPVTVFTESAGKLVNMNDGPTIGSGSLAAGTYKCVIMELSDNLKFTPSATTGSCAAGTEYTIDVFKQSSTSSKLLDLTTVTGSSSEQKMAVYISTLSTSEGGGSTNNPMMPPTSSSDAASNGVKLNGALEVSTDKTMTFYMVTTGKVDGSGSTCDLQPPTFGFRS